MGNRTVPWEEAIKAEVSRDGGMTFAYDIQPGDATRYLMTITAIREDVASVVGERGYVVTVYNLRGWPVSMFVRSHDKITWEDVRELLGISAEGSCWMITHILEHLIGTKADSYNKFCASYLAWRENLEKEKSAKVSKGGRKRKPLI